MKLKPEYVTEAMISSWKQKGFVLHYIPHLELINHSQFSISRPNINILKNTKPLNRSHSCSGRWILIEKRCLLRSRTPWINSQDMYLLTLLNLKVKKWLQKRTVINDYDDPLQEILTKHGQYSRFCMSIPEIKEILPDIKLLLDLPDTCKVRLPHYIEYCHLSLNFYPEWANLKTWEWLEDTHNDNRHLATGYKTWNILGHDPVDFWSTILGFRTVVELH